MVSSLGCNHEVCSAQVILVNLVTNGNNAEAPLMVSLVSRIAR